jgi:hypothetical protein
MISPLLNYLRGILTDLSQVLNTGLLLLFTWASEGGPGSSRGSGPYVILVTVPTQ